MMNTRPGAVEVHRPHAGIVAFGGRLPIFAAIPAGHQATHLDGPVNVIGISRIYRHADDPFHDLRGMHGDVGENHVGGVHLLPTGSAILGTADGAAVVAREHDVGVLGMAGQRPDLPVGRVQLFPVVPPVAAAVHTLLGAGENHLGVFGMHHQSPDLRAGWQARRNVGPLFFTVGPSVDAALVQGRSFCAHDQGVFTTQSYINIRAVVCVSHVRLL